MRTSSIAGAAFLLVGAGAAAVSAGPDADGNNLVLNGSDTLFEVTQDVLTACPTATGDGISYAGGGSGVGAGQMDLNVQQVSPMSRALKTSEYCGVTIDYDNDATTGTNGKEFATKTTTEDLMVGLDGIVLEANAVNACTNSLATGGTFQVTDINGVPVVTCPGCNGSGQYTIADSLDVLRLVYGGMTHDGPANTFDCNGNVRRSLVKNWNLLFSAACSTNNCTGGLTHAWRRSDLSGTTDAFVTLVGFGTRGIGTLSTAPVAAARKTNPFCNGADANGAIGVACAGISPSPCTSTQTCDTNGFCMPASFGGSTDFSDVDPIRTVCVPGEQVCNSGLNANGSALTAISGTLGLVLPILLPDNKVNPPTAADDYPTTTCKVGVFDLVSSGNNHERCPGGPNFLGSCFQPFAQPGGAADTHHYNCIARSNAHAFGTPSGLDGRAWNLPLKAGNSGGLYNVDANGREMTLSTFRMHTTTSAANTASPVCTAGDDTTQIGCLVSADPCSIGYSGRQSDVPLANQAESINGIFPTDTNIINLVSGGTPVYPLARRLFFASLVGFSGGKLRGGEAALATCYEDNNIVKTAIAAHNFVVLPSPGIKCFSYEDAPLPSCGDSPPVVTNCGAAAGTVPSFITNQY